MDALLEQAVQGMKKNGFEVVEVRTAAEACDYLLAHIDAEKSVGVGGIGQRTRYRRAARSCAEGLQGVYQLGREA